MNPLLANPDLLRLQPPSQKLDFSTPTSAGRRLAIDLPTIRYGNVRLTKGVNAP